MGAKTIENTHNPLNPSFEGKKLTKNMLVSEEIDAEELGLVDAEGDCSSQFISSRDVSDEEGFDSINESEDDYTEALKCLSLKGESLTDTPLKKQDSSSSPSNSSDSDHADNEKSVNYPKKESVIKKEISSDEVEKKSASNAKCCNEMGCSIEQKKFLDKEKCSELKTKCCGEEDKCSDLNLQCCREKKCKEPKIICCKDKECLEAEKKNCNYEKVHKATIQQKDKNVPAAGIKLCNIM